MQPTADEVRAQLARLLASDVLATAARLRRFLGFIVERTLDGHGDEIKEYAVGIEVFDRGQEYDPRIDSIVRVEAGRLRAKLDEYYREAGAADPVVIRMPRGSYTPLFEPRREVAPISTNLEPNSLDARAPAGRWRPAFAAVGTASLLLVLLTWWLRVEPAGGTPASPFSVAVLPFTHYSTEPAVALLASRIGDGVRAELARTSGVRVVSRTSSVHVAQARQSLPQVARALNADLVVEASVLAEGDRVRIQARMVDPVADRKTSVHDFEGTAGNLEDLQRRVAAAISAAARPVSPR